MRTIRRLYFYLVTFISLEVVLWGTINLLRFVFNTLIRNDAEMLSGALSLILVGIPIFLIHWLWAQNAASRDEEELTAALRAVFFYGILLATLVPITTNLLALIDRTFIVSTQMPASRAFLGGQQTWIDNLIAIVINLLAAAYFWRILQGTWSKLPDRENYSNTRRLYRYLWVLYSLLMVIFGIQQVLRFTFYIPVNLIGGGIERDTLINGLALLFVGTPIWAYSWKVCQDARGEPAELHSKLRLTILYILALSGVVTVLSTTGLALSLLMRWLFGETMRFSEFINRIGGPISLGVPLGMVWAYYGHWLNRQIDSEPDLTHQDGMRRLYRYLLAVIGLGATLTGIIFLVSFFIDFLVATDILWGDKLRSRLAGSLATLLVGMPLWLGNWPPLQAQALLEEETGEHARRSVVRKTYLYFILFAAVIGGMSSAGYLIYQLLNTLLGGNAFELATVLNSLQIMLLFIVLLSYHLGILSQDGRSVSEKLIARQSAYPVMMIDPQEGTFGKSLLATLNKQIPGVKVSLWSGKGKAPKGSFQAVILLSTVILSPSKAVASWLEAFEGHKLVLPVSTRGWIWIGSTNQVSPRTIKQTVQAVQQLSEGQEIRLSAGTPAWVIVAYVFAAIFVLQIVLAIVVSLVGIFID
ncbi:MAG: hypothetical protein JXA13_02880 [Anaerolineales bacterium]|nr:hypothetical protein [Anaerolineales bacterium]